MTDGLESWKKMGSQLLIWSTVIIVKRAAKGKLLTTLHSGEYITHKERAEMTSRRKHNLELQHSEIAAENHSNFSQVRSLQLGLKWLATQVRTYLLWPLSKETSDGILGL